MSDSRFQSRKLWLTVFCSLWLVTPSSAIDIAEKRWGFNGKVALNRFNQLSVLVNNTTPQPFEGVLTLRKTLGGAGYVDSPIVEPIALAPFTSKWVQFYPYINGSWGESAGNENWELSWGRGFREEIPTPHVAKYQRVILDDPSGLGSRGGVFRHMSENLFPSFVSATDALQIVAMDREPKTWIPGQKEAFLDWLHLGGTLLLLTGPTGKIPEFTGPMAVLNSPLEDFRYGAGRVVKSQQQRNGFDEQRVRQLFGSIPKNYVSRNKVRDPQDPVDPFDDVDLSTQVQTNVNAYGEGTDPFSANSFLSQLKDMTKPEHNWVLLHLMFWVYIGMVFPGCYLLGKRWSDFRIVYGGLLGTVALFSFLFSVVGQRGYGESTAVHTVVIARSLKDGGLDVSSWSNVFVTGGANYLIKHNGSGALYSTCSDTESVNGRINNGADAEFLVDIPPFSNREFAMRMRMAAGSPPVKVMQYKMTSDRLEEITVVAETIKPAQTQAYVLFGNRFYMLVWQNGKWMLGSDMGDATAMLKLPDMQSWANGRNYGYNQYAQKSETAEERFKQLVTPLLSRSLNVAREAEVKEFSLPRDIVRLLFYTKMPPELAVQNSRLGRQEGHVLYSIDAPLQEP